MSGVTHETITDADDGQRLDRWLKKKYMGVPQSIIFKIIRTGQVRIDGKRAKADQRLTTGQDVRLPPVPTDREEGPKKLSEKDRAFIQSLVIYDDGDLVAIDKPGDIATQGGTKTFRHIDGLLSGLKNDKGIPRLVHRLDKETSGVLLMARSAKAVRELGFMFKGKDIEKIYYALVTPMPEMLEGIIDAPMRKTGGKDRERIILDPELGQKAQTEFKVIDHAAKKAAFVIFRPLTGRTHQIRVHASQALKTPIIGDEKYGYNSEGFEMQVVTRRPHLHAARLNFKHPLTQKQIELSASLPTDLQKSWKALGFQTKTPKDPFKS